MNELVTVVVPVYKTERYLDKCVDSIRNQTYNNLEILLVDDGSPDNCGEICDMLAAKDKRIKVIHKKNGGLSDARNVGMSIASGHYIVFCDSDDWIEATILEDALQTVLRHNADVVIWGYCADFVDNDEHLIKRVDCVPNSAVCRKTQDNHIAASDLPLGLIGYAWNKLYRIDLIRNCLFEKGVSLVEDILFNKEVLLKATTLAFLNKTGTHYVQRYRETLGTRFYPNYFELKFRACQAKEEILKCFGVHGNDLYKAMSSHYLGSLEDVVRMTSRSNHFRTNWERKEYISPIFETNRAKMILRKYRPQGLRQKGLYLLMRLKAYSIMIWLFQTKSKIR